MTTMITEVYEAFKSCGATEDKARKAAEAMSTQKDDTAEIKSQLKLLHWMVGFILAFVMAILWKVF